MNDKEDHAHLCSSIVLAGLVKDARLSTGCKYHCVGARRKPFDAKEMKIDSVDQMSLRLRAALLSSHST